jgi:hypothetical protein
VPLDRIDRILVLGSPILFATHELEEYWTVLPWLHRHRADLPTFLQGRLPDGSSFILIAGVAFLLIFGVVAALVVERPEARVWAGLFAILILARLENALMHVGQAVWFRGYAPGLITAVTVVLPLSCFVLGRLTRARRLSTRSFVWMVPVGFVVQLAAVAAVAWPAFWSATPSRLGGWAAPGESSSHRPSGRADSVLGRPTANPRGAAAPRWPIVPVAPIPVTRDPVRPITAEGRPLEPDFQRLVYDAVIH